MISSLIIGLLLQTLDPSTTEAAQAEDERPMTLLLYEVQRASERIGKLRGQSFDGSPDAVRVPEHICRAAAEIRAFNVLPHERLRARGLAWSDVGLGSPDSPRQLLLTLASDIDGIALDPQESRLLISPGRMTGEDFEVTDRPDDPAIVLLMTGMRPDEPLLVHQLMHLLQRKRSGFDSLEETTDGLLASMARAEGEANLVAISYLFQQTRVGPDILQFVKDPASVLDGGLVPAGVAALGGIEAGLASFVYQEGLVRSIELYYEGGWKRLDEGLARLRTTRDWLHPGIPPLPDPGFPESPAAPFRGLELADTDSLGEQAIVVMVSALTGKDSLGLQAGDGWAGDRLYRWQLGEDPQVGVTEWVTRWQAAGGDLDRTADKTAEDFDYAFGRALEARFPGRRFEARGDGQRALATPDRVFRIERKGAEVRILASPPALDAVIRPGEPDS